MKRYLILLICLVVIIIVAIFGSSGSGVPKSEVSLGKYIDIEAEVVEKKLADADIENAIIDFIVTDQEDVEINNRPVRNGDTVNIDYSGKVDGVKFEGGTETDHDLIIGAGDFIEGFEEQIIGMKIGQTADIKVTFPDPYLPNDDLSGAEAVFTVKVNSIHGKVIPTKITDDMIKEKSDTYSTIKQYRDYIVPVLESKIEETNKLKKQEALWKVIVDNCTVTSLSNKKVKYYSDLYESDYQYWADMYGVDLNTLIKDYMGTTREKFDADKKKSAENLVTKLAIVEAIAEEQDISISNDEYQEYLDNNGIGEEEAKQYGEKIKDDMLYEKVIDFVASKARVTFL